MVVKDPNTITITALGFKDGKDLSKDMHLELSGNNVILSQKSFKAVGTIEDNLYPPQDTFDGIEFSFRLYALGDKYVVQLETWKHGKIQQINMSYLTRKKAGFKLVP